MIKVGFVGLDINGRRFFTRELVESINIKEKFRPLFYTLPLIPEMLDPDIEVLSVFTDAKVDKKIFDALPKLKLIACRSTGYDNIDMKLAEKKRVTVTNTPSYGASSVAEYTFAMILMLSRKLPEIIHESFSPNPNRTLERGFDLHGKTIGIIGLGDIGKGVAQIAYGMGMKILAYDIKKDERVASWLRVEYVDEVEKLLKKSDIVTLHIPYREDNRHFMDAKKLELMKNSALLINTARGELIDTVALMKALNNRQISGAALDVVENEYLLDPDEIIDLAGENTSARSSLRHALALLALERMPNVIITNHNAFNTVEAIERINKMVLDNIIGFYNGSEIHIV